MSDLISRSEAIKLLRKNMSNDIQDQIITENNINLIESLPTAFDTERVVEQLENVIQDLNVIEVISHIDFDSTIQTSLENFLNAFKSEIMRIVKNNACIDELLKGEEG